MLKKKALPLLFGVLLLVLFIVKGYWIGFVTLAYLAFLFLWLASSRLLRVELVLSLVVFVGFHVVLSFCPLSSSALIFYGVFGIVFLFSAIRFRDIRDQSVIFYRSISTFGLMDIVSVFLFSIFIICYGLSKKDGFYCVDSLHHFYELSWGRSYGDGVLNAQDLSYFLRPARFHFLGTRLSILLSAVWHVSLEQSVAYLALLFYFPIIIVTSVCLMQCIGVTVPLLALLMFPLFGLKSCFYYPTLSILLGTEVFLASIWSFIQKRWLMFFVLIPFLLIAKASFFIVLMGAVCLVFLKKPSYRFALGLMACLAVFVVGFKLFLSGAHEHILWLHFPGSLFWLIYHKKWDLLVYLFSFLTILGFYFFTLPKDSKKLLPTAIGLSGILGVLLIVEVTSGDHLQFLKAAGLPAIMALWAAPIPFFKTGFKYKKMVFYGLIAVYGATFFLKPISSFLLKEPCVTRDVISAYTALGKMANQKDVVLYGKHYEVNLMHCSDSSLRDSYWYSRTGFERSALSGAQMLDESVKWKGVVMEKALPLRIAQTLFFYQRYVLPSFDSQVRMAQFQSDWFGRKEPLPVSAQVGREAWLIRHFGFHKDWYFMNQMDLLNRQIRMLLEGSSENVLTGIDFLKFYHIRFIVLEDGDLPTPELLGFSTQVFQSPTVRVFRVNDTVFHD